ncbi:poly(3-hydroxyalkanoate) depolymerase [Luminiphilus syltensis NOR5-1B]|uniref:Poly(3-hydroxyalkanoate) depolymerase n=1 Tax=Luminiphilus syltensis NOR5-1B TaxID=565045 RepID=B8KX72_9GAMM|nr:alpha/beta fold hydrolase [Luminiphilus syltensis]EED35304.1 poly(3-hydroxyalkanoate) depolymerase [Luminiphilus syltensis NOR5-1B]
MSGAHASATDRVYRLGKFKIRVKVNIPERPGPLPPLLLCNGYGLPLDVLDPIVAKLKDVTVIRFDAPGIGGSPATLLPYRFSTLATLLNELLDKLEYDTVDVYGMSWGGMVAQQLALDYPARCRKLILAATISGIVSLPGNIALHSLKNPSLFWQSPKISRLASMLYGGRVRKAEWRKLERNLALYAPDLPGYLWQAVCIFWWTTAHRLRALRQPTLLLFGRDDPTVPLSNGKLLQFLIPDSTLVQLDCGHLFPWTRQAQVYEEVQAFRQ